MTKAKRWSVLIDGAHRYEYQTRKEAEVKATYHGRGTLQHKTNPANPHSWETVAYYHDPSRS